MVCGHVADCKDIGLWY